MISEEARVNAAERATDRATLTTTKNGDKKNSSPDLSKASLSLSFSLIFFNIDHRGSTAVAAAAPAASTAARSAPAAPSAATANANESSTSRRTLLASLAGAALVSAAQLSSPPAPLLLPRASAAIGVWDGRAASGSCDLGPEGDECRARTLARDFGRASKAAKEEGYGESIRASSGLSTNTNSIPIPSMQGGAYADQTRALGGSIREYLALSPSDASRVPKGRELRKAGAVWAAKYAPGGSARLKSARCAQQ